MAPPQRVLCLSHRNKWKILKNILLQNYLLRMLEIRYVALPSGLLRSKFVQTKVRGSKVALRQGLLGLKHRHT